MWGLIWPAIFMHIRWLKNSRIKQKNSKNDRSNNAKSHLKFCHICSECFFCQNFRKIKPYCIQQNVQVWRLQISQSPGTAFLRFNRLKCWLHLLKPITMPDENICFDECDQNILSQNQWSQIQGWMCRLYQTCICVVSCYINQCRISLKTIKFHQIHRKLKLF